MFGNLELRQNYQIELEDTDGLEDGILDGGSND
jgi:hypothetical protein